MTQTTGSNMSQPEKPIEESASKEPITFKVNAKTTEGNLLVEYYVKNTRNQPIYLFNVLWDFNPQGDYVAAPSPAYVCFRKGNVLHVAKQIPKLPLDAMVEVTIVPFVTKVEPDAEYKETIKLPLPVKEYSPYFPFEEDSKFEQRMAESVIFTLQFVNQLKDMEVKPGMLPDSLRLYHPGLLKQVETLQSKAIPIAVTVNERADEFEEF